MGADQHFDGLPTELPPARPYAVTLPDQHPVLVTETITTNEGFRNLQAEWNDLVKGCSSRSFFLTWEWLYTWWQHQADDRTLCIMTVRHDGRLIAIAPLVSRPSRFMRLLPFSVLEFLGSGSVGSDYLNFPVRDGYEDAALRALAGCITERDSVLELAQVERLSSRMINFAIQLRLLGWHTHRTTVNFCPFISLRGKSWADYLGTLGSNHRTNLRRRLKKLSATFNVRIEKVGTEQQRAKALDTLVSLHLKRWSQRGGSDALHTDALLAFHEELTKTALANDWLRLHVMWLDDVPVAAVYGFFHNNVYYFYQAGFDVNFSDYSVGLVMMGMTIKSAIEEGAEEFDFLHGEETYKYLWTREERELVRFDMFPPHTRGSLYSQFMQLRHSIKRLVWQWFPSRNTDLNPGPNKSPKKSPKK
ncbi:MAG: GNAT family N-acetyltransferase [Pseudomonadota bacterium]